METHWKHCKVSDGRREWNFEGEAIEIAVTDGVLSVYDNGRVDTLLASFNKEGWQWVRVGQKASDCN